MWDSYDEPRGSYEVIRDEKGIPCAFWFACPGCASISCLPIRPSIAKHSWEFNGNEESPTLHPSINHVGCWHGWLTNGEFIRV